jgi:ComF family protein
LLRRDCDGEVCSLCRPEHAPLPATERRQANVEALLAYQGPAATAVNRLKFSGDLAVAGPLGRMLAGASILDEPWDSIAPVPLHWRRTLARGFNQSHVLAAWMMRHRGLSKSLLEPRLLRRKKHGPPQRELPAERRLSNVRGAFEARSAARVAERRILLVDDVTTTGATLHACTAALRRAGASRVGGLALLRTLA